jgi:L-lactate utilization protein LutB
MAALGNAEALRTEHAPSKSAPWRAWMSTSNASPRRRSAWAQVHWARDAAEARQIITGIAQHIDAHVIVKGKSMATEEIHLNPHLEQHGYEVVETDLGEYIIQLAGDTIAHYCPGDP